MILKISPIILAIFLLLGSSLPASSVNSDPDDSKITVVWLCGRAMAPTLITNSFCLLYKNGTILVGEREGTQKGNRGPLKRKVLNRAEHVELLDKVKEAFKASFHDVVPRDSFYEDGFLLLIKVGSKCKHMLISKQSLSNNSLPGSVQKLIESMGLIQNQAVDPWTPGKLELRFDEVEGEASRAWPTNWNIASLHQSAAHGPAPFLTVPATDLQFCKKSYLDETVFAAPNGRCYKVANILVSFPNHEQIVYPKAPAILYWQPK